VNNIIYFPTKPKEPTKWRKLWLVPLTIISVVNIPVILFMTTLYPSAIVTVGIVNAMKQDHPNMEFVWWTHGLAMLAIAVTGGMFMHFVTTKFDRYIDNKIKEIGDL